MNEIGQTERATQSRVVALLRDELHYRHLGDWPTHAEAPPFALRKSQPFSCAQHRNKFLATIACAAAGATKENI